ncbi:MAG: hypothetical protein AABY83_13865 [Pseudomonadota bacterium]
MKTRFHVVCGLVLMVACTAASANEQIVASKNKLGVNMLGLLLLGDVNGSYERYLTRQISLVATAHYVASSKYVAAEGEGYRITGGVRVYGNIENWNSAFFELKTGMSRYNDDNGQAVAGQGAPLSLEFYGGSSNQFNDFLFYEMKLGLIRFVRSGDVTPGAGFAVGVQF